FLAKIFEIFSKYKKSVDLIATTEVSVSVSIDNDSHIKDIVNELKHVGEITINPDRVSISIIGDGLKSTQGRAGKIFSVVGEQGANIEMITQGASEINATFVIEKDKFEPVITALHKEFFE
ncbi:ACT domain-containing protein, partial [Nanoarchaeota archaeon]